MPKLTIDQLVARHDGIGSSDVAELLGLSPYEGASPMRLFLEKSTPYAPNKCDACKGTKFEWRGVMFRTQFVSDEVPAVAYDRPCPRCDATGIEPEEENIAFELGHLVEPVLIDFYARKKNIEWEPGGTVTSTRHRWAFATVDAHYKNAMRGIECKFVGGAMIRGWDKYLSDGVPQHVRVQNCWQMYVTGYDAIDTVAMLGGPSGFAAFEVLHDAELEGMVVGAAEKFWRDLQQGIAPALDDSAATRKYLDTKYPAPAADVAIVVSEPEIIALGVDHCTAAAIIKDATANRATWANQIIEHMGKHGATLASCEEWKATYRPNKNGKRSLIVSAKGELRATGKTSKHDDGGDDGEIF